MVKKVQKKIEIKNKSMEAFNYPTLGRVVFANSKEEADEKVKKFEIKTK